MYVRTSSATGGLVLPIGPSELGKAGPILGLNGGETVLWVTGELAATARTFVVPVDGTISHVAIAASTDGSIADMVVTDPQGLRLTPQTAGAEVSTLGCVRGFGVRQPEAGAWTLQITGTGTFWLVVHAKTDLLMAQPAFVRAAGRPGDGPIKTPGEPIAGEPAMLQTVLTTDQVADASFDLISTGGESLQAVDLRLVTPDVGEVEFRGSLAALPTGPFRVRVRGLDKTGTPYQRVSSFSFLARTVEVVAPRDVVLARGQRNAVKVRLRNVGGPVLLRVRALRQTISLLTEPDVVQLAEGDTGEVTVWTDVPPDAPNAPGLLIVSAESAGSETASNRAIINTTVGPSP